MDGVEDALWLASQRKQFAPENIVGTWIKIIFLCCIVSLFQYILKQLFTAVSVAGGGYYLAALQLG